MMKKKITRAVLLSTVALMASAQLAPTAVIANNIDEKIAQQDSVIEAAENGAAEAKAAQDELQKKVDAGNEQLKKLEAETREIGTQIESLRENIKERKVRLDSQARSAQMNGGTTSYINTVLNAKSITDVVQKITAMTEVVSANNEMMKQQELDQKDLQKKLVNSEKVYNQAEALQQQLGVQQAELRVAQLNYQATITTAQGEKDSLLKEKSEAEEIARKVQEEAAERARNSSVSGGGAVNNNAVTSFTGSSVSSVRSSRIVGGTSAIMSPGSLSSSNPYPYGQCTWGTYQYMQQYFGVTIPRYYGNAGDWIVYANSGASAGTIAVFSPGQAGNGYGHVAVVLSVNGGEMTIVEANYLGSLFNQRTVPISSASGFIRP